MTTDIDKLEGPELDRLVAEKVMGWIGYSFFREGSIEQEWKTATGYRKDFYPSSDMVAAWEVVLSGRFYSVTLDAGTRYSTIEASIRKDVADEPVMADAPTAPLALCRAALKAVMG